MTTNKIVQEFEFKSEVFPILIIGITLNLSARLVRDLLGFDFFFLDTAGTAFSAILLGPWWAATVGVISNTINGNFVHSFFAYGVGNIFLGLGWGYFVRWTNLHKTLFRPGWITFKRIFYSYLGLVLVGTAVGTFSTILVKSIINPAMGRPYIYREFYIHGRDWLHSNIWAGLNDFQVMALIDAARELAGKAILVGIALFFVYAVAFIPATVSPIGKQSLSDRLKTDSVSIFVFMIGFGFYLFIGRWFNEVLVFSAGDISYDLHWLTVPNLIVLFYAPIVLAALTFLLLSLDGTQENGKRVNARRWRRRNLYAILSLSKNKIAGGVGRHTFFKDPRFKSIYGLIISLSIWPFRQNPKEFFTNPIYLLVLLLFAGIYFYSSRQYQRLFKRSQLLLKQLHEWMRDCTAPSDPVQISHTFHKIFSDRLTFTEKDPLNYKSITYSPCITVASPEGFKGENSQTWLTSEGLVFAVVNHPRVMTEDVIKDITKVSEASAIRKAFVLSSNPNIMEPRILERMREARKKGLEINLLSWIDLELAIRYYSKKRDVLTALTQSRVRTLENLGLGRRLSQVDESRAQTLAGQTIPTLAQVIDNLPKNSTIFDLGCTRGCHTFFGLFKGHQVLACCGCASDVHALSKCVEEHERESQLLRLHEGDFMKLDPQNAGTANLVLAQGILHKAKSQKELQVQLGHLKNLADEPGANIFIEMFFGVDSGKKTIPLSPVDRIEFEGMLNKVFGSEDWDVERIAGPVRRVKNLRTQTAKGAFKTNTREVWVVDYLLTRET